MDMVHIKIVGISGVGKTSYLRQLQGLAFNPEYYRTNYTQSETLQKTIDGVNVKLSTTTVFNQVEPVDAIIFMIDERKLSVHPVLEQLSREQVPSIIVRNKAHIWTSSDITPADAMIINTRAIHALNMVSSFEPIRELLTSLRLL